MHFRDQNSDQIQTKSAINADIAANLLKNTFFTCYIEAILIKTKQNSSAYTVYIYEIDSFSYRIFII